MENNEDIKKQERRKKSKRLATLLLLLIMLVTVTIGFALLSTSLGIRGTSTITKASWDIDAGPIECPANQVCTIDPDDPEDLTPDDGTPTCTDANDPTTCTDPTGAVLWMEGNTVYFKHVLDRPGDVFTFTVGFTNNGNIDAKIVDVVKSGFGANSTNTTANKFMSYDVTYADGSTIAAGDELKVGQSRKFKVVVTYKDVIENGQTILPTDAELALINEIAEGHTGATSLFTVEFEQD